MKFKESGLELDLLKDIAQTGFEEATPITAETIPLVLEGQDVIGTAQTGTGKTAAFGLHILTHIDKADRSNSALDFSHTRELAILTTEELYRRCREQKIQVLAVVGGADIRRQIRLLADHPTIVVGTPGRILELIGRLTLKLEHLDTLVLDEADEMLDMGYFDDIEKIVETMPTERTTSLFSATMPAANLRLTQQYLKEPVIVQIKE